MKNDKNEKISPKRKNMNLIEQINALQEAWNLVQKKILSLQALPQGKA